MSNSEVVPRRFHAVVLLSGNNMGNRRQCTIEEAVFCFVVKVTQMPVKTVKWCNAARYFSFTGVVWWIDVMRYTTSCQNYLATQLALMLMRTEASYRNSPILWRLEELLLRECLCRNLPVTEQLGWRFRPVTEMTNFTPCREKTTLKMRWKRELLLEVLMTDR